MAVQVSMALIETLANGRNGVPRQRLARQLIERRAQLISLAGIAQIKLTHEEGATGTHPFRRKLLVRLRFELLKDLFGMIGLERSQWPQLRTNVIVHDVRAEKAEGREGAWPEGPQDAPPPERGSDRGRVHAARSAKRQERERGEIDASLGGKYAHRVGHSHVDNARYSRGGSRHIEPKRAGDMRFDCRSSRRHVQLVRTAEKVIGIEITADEIGIGDGRSQPATPVAGRTRIGSRAVRADIEESPRLHQRNRASARGNARHVKGGHMDLAPRDDAFAQLERRAPLDESDVGAGAAHVESHKAVPRVLAEEIRARLRAGGGTGEERMHGAPARDRSGKRHHAAVRLHQKTLRRGNPGAIEPLIEVANITNQKGFEIGVEQRGREPRPFPYARQDLARQRYVNAGMILLDQRARSLLVRRMHE